MNNILIIGNDGHIGNMLEEILSLEGYGVMRAFSESDAVMLLGFISPDLILLDSEDHGVISVIGHTRGIPVIVLRPRTDDGVLADVDYMIRPFDIKELFARIGVHLRLKRECAGESLISAGELSLDCFTHDFAVGNEPVSLTVTECLIMEFFMLEYGNVVPREDIIDKLKKYGCTGIALKQHISNLRRKIRKAGGREHIETVYGIGFRLTDE